MARERKVKEVQTGGGGKVLAFFLGILMGIIIIFGALGGAAYYVYTRPIKDTIKLIDGGDNGKIYQILFGSDGQGGYLDASYASKKVGDLVKDTTTAVKALSSDGTLSDVEKISPKVRAILKKALDKTDAYEVPLTEEELMSKPVKELGSYTVAQLKQTPLGGLLKGFNGGEETDDKLMLALCYGEEGVDYTWEDGKIVMQDGAEKTTVKQIVTDGIGDLFDKITLDTMDIDPSDPIMRTLAYGPESHYTTVKNEAGIVTGVEMKQVQFSWDGATMFDVDGAPVMSTDTTTYPDLGGTFTNNVLTLKSGETYYLATTAKARSGEAATPSTTTYYAYSDANCEKKALYPKTKVNELTNDASSLVDDLYLSDALNVNETSHRVLITLAYGAEGEGYTVNADGTITLKDDVTPRTIGELKTKNKDLIDGIFLKDALGINKSSHKVLIALACGKEGVDFEYDGNNVKMLETGKGATTLGQLSGDGSQALINDIELAVALNVTPASHRVLQALAFGPGYYTDAEGNLQPAAPNQPRTLGDLSGDKSTDIINDIELADALNVTPTSDPILITLAYGKEGRDYTIENKGTPDAKIQPIAAPRTLLSLSTGDMSAILDDIALTDVIDAQLDSAIIMYLLYGREGVHFKKDLDGEGNEIAVPLQQRIAIAEIEGVKKAYNAYGEPWVGSFGSNGTFNTFTVGEGESAITYVYKAMPATVTNRNIKVKEGEKIYDATFYYLFKEDGETEILYEPTTIGELSGTNNTISMLNKRLTVGEILGDASVNDNMFLKHIKNETIDSLPEAINNLKVDEVYAEDVFMTKKEGDVLYFVEKDGTTLIAPTTAELTDVQKEKRVVTGTWWYLLHNEESCHLKGHCSKGENCAYVTGASATCDGTLDCYDSEAKRSNCINTYSIKDFDKLIANMTDNMKNASLHQLEIDGIITPSAGTDLDATYIKIPDPSNPPANPHLVDGTAIGELTIKDLLDYLTYIIDFLNRNP